jgi:hypothetical protein
LVGGLVVVPVVVVGVVDDPQDLDEAEGGSQSAQGRLQVGVDLGHGRSRLPLWWLVASGPEVQVDAAALEVEFVVISSRAKQWVPDQQHCVVDGVRDVL